MNWEVLIAWIRMRTEEVGRSCQRNSEQSVLAQKMRKTKKAPLIQEEQADGQEKDPRLLGTQWHPQRHVSEELGTVQINCSVMSDSLQPYGL